MLDSETKRRIDTARDILVGKVPDPKSQVEQITIALIYKFMDDMDAEAEELGGKRSYFVGEYEKFSWAKLMSPSLGGHEALSLYSEAIDRMTRNEGVPQLFRDIFKNAFLPYRDPETLRLFLKTINEFTYDHSERLGDAFEYLLSVLGSQGDAGQFRTPRHIIEFMVKVVNPQKDESILDPACGTAGFLISAYKHILRSNSTPLSLTGHPPKSDEHQLDLGGTRGVALTPPERTKLANNIWGYDISPDMVRLSLVNLYLHGFTTPKIFEYDTLTDQARWDEYADVILANPPFMSPRGGIQPHKRFSVQSNRSEVLFVDYIAEHLTPNGRAAVIVPEGIIFQSGKAYKQLRKALVENHYLWAVVSLPAGVFNPYAGVKTSILFLDKALAKKRALSGVEGTDQILFVKVEADGFDLGAQRRPIDRNDLPQTLKVLESFRDSILDGKPASFAPTVDSALLVSASSLAENGDYNLSADRYREAAHIRKHSIPLVLLKNVAYFQEGPGILSSQYTDNGYPMVNVGNVRDGYLDISKTKFVSYEMASGKWAHFQIQENDILFTTSGTIGRVSKVKKEDLPLLLNTSVVRFKPLDVNQLAIDYLYQILRSEHFVNELLKMKTGSAQFNVGPSHLKQLNIPLPPLEVQRQIVDEIAAHQRIIDGARQVVEGWKPSFEVDDEWSVANLGGIAELEYGFTASAEETGDTRFIRITDINDDGTLNPETSKYVNLADENKSYLLHEGDLLVARTGATYGKTLYFENGEQSLFASYLIRIRFNKNVSVLPKYYWYFARSDEYWQQARSLVTGGGQPQFNGNALKQISLPLPPLDIQREIVARIEKERAIVESNRELIRIYEEKVKKVIERVWEG